MNDFFKAIDQTADWMGSLLYQGCEAIFQELEDAAIEVEDALSVALEPVLGWLDEVEETLTGTSRPFVQTVAPALQDHAACVGCTHYHGETYGGHVLVCGMHPYGVEDPTCPDWKSVWTQ